MRQLILQMSIAIVLAIVPLRSQDIVFKNGGSDSILVELYSSEGCSSCPPAEAWLSTLKDSPELWKTLFPVAFHVDYWDGLGWPDRFAKAAYTQRQQNYAARLGQDSVYTPEFVTGGREWRGWFDGGRTPSVQTETKGNLSLVAKDQGARVSVMYAPAYPDVTAYTVNIALLGNNVLSDVQRGENGGRQLRHDFVVLDYASYPLTKAKKFQSGLLNMKPATTDPAAAIVAWISPETEQYRR
jgi:hypothetical protein